MTDVSGTSAKTERQDEIVDQSDDLRDPADDSGESDDPSAMADTYPQVFDDRVSQAEAAIESHNVQQDDRSGGGNG